MTECIEHPSRVSTDKYPTVKRNGKYYDAHRWAYMCAYGPIPSGMVVRHSCHNKKCVNPDHLSLGTQKENIMDSLKAGRLVRKLSQSDVDNLRNEADGSYGQHRVLAEKYGVSIHMVRKVLSGDRRTHRVEDTA
tara:strand:+ start:2055 stop:2456 length:402 start_codon:yes stop_codon:yes gene_type:complete